MLFCCADEAEIDAMAADPAAVAALTGAAVTDVGVGAAGSACTLVWRLAYEFLDDLIGGAGQKPRRPWPRPCR